MKRVLQFLVVVSFCTLSSAWAETAGVNDREAQAVIQALEYPQNLSAELLKSAIESAKAMGSTMERVKVTKLDQDRYEVIFTLNNKEAEMARITVSEVMVSSGKAYVFGFGVERVVQMRKHPGVSMGNN